MSRLWAAPQSHRGSLRAVWAGWVLLAYPIVCTWGAGAEGSGGAVDTGPSANLGGRILKEILATQAHQLLFAVIQWALLGALLGLVVGILAVIMARALGGYRSEWKHARWIRWPCWGVTVIGCVVLLGLAGFWQGIIQGGEQILRKSQLATHVFPEVGAVVADGVAALQVYLADTNAAERSSMSLSNRVAEFRAGAWEVNAAQFVRQVDRVESGMVSNLVATLEREAVKRNARLKEGLANTVLHQVLRLFGAVLLPRDLNSGMRRLGLKPLYHALHDKMVAQAERQGNPETISRQELTGLIVNEGVVPVVMQPIRSLAGSQVLFCIVLALLLALFLPMGFRWTCGKIGKPKQA